MITTIERSYSALGCDPAGTHKCGHDTLVPNIVCLCRKVRVFWFAKAKLRRVYDESTEAAEELQRSENGALRVEAIDFGKRMATERTLNADDSAPHPNAVFDSSGNFLIYPTILGIKVGLPS